MAMVCDCDLSWYLEDVPVYEDYNIGIKHSFSCINIHQVLWEVLKTEAGGLKPCLITIIAYKLKTFATFRITSCTILFRLFTDVSRMQFPWTMLGLGPGSTHLVMAANPWPRYEHIESCVAVH